MYENVDPSIHFQVGSQFPSIRYRPIQEILLPFSNLTNSWSCVREAENQIFSLDLKVCIKVEISEAHLFLSAFDGHKVSS